MSSPQDFFNQQIQFYKDQIEFYKDQLKQKDETIKDLIEKLSAPSCQVIQTSPVNMKQIYDLSMNLTSQNRVIDPQPEIKNKYDRWLQVDCKDALNIDEFISRMSEIVTQEMYVSICSRTFLSKYLYVIKETFKTLQTNEYPIQIKCNTTNKEEGYIKTDDKFEKIYRTNLYEKLGRLVKYRIKNVLLTQHAIYTQSREYNRLDEEEKTAINSTLFGLEEVWESGGNDNSNKKINSLVKSIIDLCMMPV